MFLKAGDTAPAFTADLNADISGATARVYFKNSPTGTTIFDRALTITDATNGIVSYQWASPGDASLISTVGAYQADVVVTFADGRLETFPQRSYLEVVVKA